MFAHSPRSPASRIRGPPAPSSLRKATGQQPFWSLLSDCGSLSPHCLGPFLGSTPQSSGKESRRTHENRKPPGGRFGRGGGLSTTSGAGVLTTPSGATLRGTPVSLFAVLTVNSEERCPSC